MVLSTEKPRCKLVDMTGGGNLADFQARVTAGPEPCDSILAHSQQAGGHKSCGNLACFRACEKLTCLAFAQRIPLPTG